EISHAHLAPVRKASTGNANLATWFEAAERNMPPSRHRAMIISVWQDFFNTPAPQTGLSASRLLWFQRDEAAAALAPNAYQNLFVRLQFFADGDQLLCISDRLLVHFLNHVAFTQPSFCGRRVGINFGNHGSSNVL